ncbi:hypothetical protein V8C86DRAFT_3129635 [Haematococcus lacustris]
MKAQGAGLAFPPAWEDPDNLDTRDLAMQGSLGPDGISCPPPPQHQSPPRPQLLPPQRQHQQQQAPLPLPCSGNPCMPPALLPLRRLHPAAGHLLDVHQLPEVSSGQWQLALDLVAWDTPACQDVMVTRVEHCRYPCQAAAAAQLTLQPSSTQPSKQRDLAIVTAPTAPTAAAAAAAAAAGGGGGATSVPMAGGAVRLISAAVYVGVDAGASATATAQLRSTEPQPHPSLPPHLPLPPSGPAPPCPPRSHTRPASTRTAGRPVKALKPPTPPGSAGPGSRPRSQELASLGCGERAPQRRCCGPPAHTPAPASCCPSPHHPTPAGTSTTTSPSPSPSTSAHSSTLTSTQTAGLPASSEVWRLSTHTGVPAGCSSSSSSSSSSRWGHGLALGFPAGRLPALCDMEGEVKGLVWGLPTTPLHWELAPSGHSAAAGSTATNAIGAACGGCMGLDMADMELGGAWAVGPLEECLMGMVEQDMMPDFWNLGPGMSMDTSSLAGAELLGEAALPDPLTPSLQSGLLAPLSWSLLAMTCLNTPGPREQGAHPAWR